MPRFFLWALIAIVAIAPLPLGSNRPLGWSLLSLEVGILLVCWSVHHIWTGQALPVNIDRIKGPLVLFALTCVWVLVQLIPNLPLGLAHPAWQEVNIFFGSNVPERITIDPDQSVTGLMRWMAYAGVFWLSLQLARDRTAAKTALRAFVVIAAGYALYGLVAMYLLGDTILLYDKWTGKGSVTSTFTNRNSYATFAGLGLIATTALIIGSRRRSDVPLFSWQRLHDTLSHTLSSSLFAYVLLFVSATALLLTGSRAGALSTLAAFIVLLSQFSRGKQMGVPSRVTGMVAFLILGVGVVGFSGGFLGERFSQGGSNLRFEGYEKTASAVEDHALLGSGLGSFAQIFPLYRETEVLRDKFVTKAHNTYLENALELGLPATLCLTLAACLLAWQCWKGVVSRARDRHFPAMGFSASVLVGLHAIVDFSLQIPAVAVAYMFLLGIAVAQSYSSRRG
ncbi:MAG: O-antigen ligase family protein [Rhodobiaceae bacterium]|nr:O-antigen ligase family protein [Rhodobiaceae bacterium]